MANKQFRMEKILGTSVCADISQNALKNQQIKFLYDIFLDEHFEICRFLDQFRLEKTVFTNSAPLGRVGQ